MIAEYIDHTLLRADAVREEIVKLAEEAAAHRFASVCVNPCWVGLCHSLLAGSGVKVCTVIGFPLGASSAKAEEARKAIADGADEVDMVINIGFLKSGMRTEVLEDIKAVRAASQGRILKVIIETCLLTDDEKRMACALAMEADADFVKTSTGFSSGGASVRDVALMKEAVGGKLGVKASGGIRSYSDAKAMLDAGASRIGTSAGVRIAEQELS